MEADVRSLLGTGGALEQSFENFRPRPEQLEMAHAVAQTVGAGGCLVVEAGTGTGKTFAYLIPALLSGKRVLISTATKALQDQLVHRDLPRLQEVLGKHRAVHRRVALLKGRANYLCLHRLDQAVQGLLDAGVSSSPILIARAWAQSTRSGDLAELGELHADAHLQAQITSTRDNCLRGQCPRYDDCHVFRARRQAMAADVAVVNHHLFFADLAGAAEGGESDLLAHAQVVIFDEAHSLNSVGQQAFGLEFSSRQLVALAHDLQQTGSQEAQGMRDWTALAMELLDAARALAACCNALSENTRVAWQDEAPDGVSIAKWMHAWAAVAQSLRAALAELDAVTAASPDLLRLHQRAVLMLQGLMALSSTEDASRVRWLTRSADGVHLSQTPFRAGPDLQRLWATAQPREGGEKEESAWSEDAVKAAPEHVRAFIFTSATLGTNDALDWFTEPLGLSQAAVMRLASPFDYASQATLFIPEHLPSANDLQHAAQLAEWLAGPLVQLGGRTLFLTTSLRAMGEVARVLHERLADVPQIELLVQGDMPSSRIAERFQSSAKSSEAGLRSGCVLVASHTYWQGFDVPGDALQMVVIDKLPFPVPTDPLVEAYEQYLIRRGRNAFKEFALQEAAMALRQGAGRLIRGETDSGLLVVADARLAKGYGKWLQRQLPPMRRLASQAEFQSEIERLSEGLTRTSTTDRSSSQNRT
ncbi:ATP-dependent DNA helicase [Diaphorobacter sp. HDW4A]|uniref:ATP-dependent DNA helicase n=1 Tax=Diaphorobacter sp. HDW4A TaxID=2714924 RepID=UPI00140C936A|nr:ATP-dependent DNA helicase [Diaphorobacter sp. HDW4A]QIL83846.1 ATP-dependent DNA helicase [Diaphorobacter sp. HDW4A]